MPKSTIPSEVDRLRQAHLDLQKKLAACARELMEARVQNVRLFNESKEALEQQSATSEVLKVISRSAFDLQPVLQSLLEAAVRLCDADKGIIYRQDGDIYRMAAAYGESPEFIGVLERNPHRPGRQSTTGRALIEHRVIHIHDAMADPEYTWAEDERGEEIRTVLAVPMLRESTVIGVFIIRRTQVRPFTEKQIELVTTFADQAAIAIENVRLFQELQARNRELTVALEQQAATAEILRVISRSPSDALPVFETIARDAAALCGSLFANVFRFDGALIHCVASHSTGPGYMELLQSKYPMRPDVSQVSGRVLLSRSVVRMEDAQSDHDYDQRFAAAGGWRQMLGVPMLREGKPLGAIVVGWAEARPVSETEESLLKTFADQAVIAIENARLFDEIRDKTHQLELANAHKSRFLAVASHDLRQPLHALNLFVGQLQTEADPAEQERLIARIDAAVHAMNELFNALLDVSRLDAGVLEPNLTEFPVEQLLKRVETTFAESAREKGLRLSVLSSSAWVRSDFILLERILFNLVSNAVRYTTRGGVVIGCRRRGRRLRLDVWDTGAGVPENQRQNIFDEFYQVASPGSDRRAGLGLGLAIVERLGRLLDHPVELTSILGKGSRFSVSVPRVAEKRGPADVPAPPAAVADPAIGKLIVVIDDDALVLDSVCGILRSWGCRAVPATSDTVAVARLRELGEQPDVIICDYRLADGKTGIQAIESLCAALGVAVPAFLVTGDIAPERLREASASGYHLLHKPVPPIALRALLNRLLKAGAASGGPAHSA
jgi:signal transduction histidine kinase/CheY-like chemotaxis protein